MLACVTRGSVFPGVQRGLGKTPSVGQSPAPGVPDGVGDAIVGVTVGIIVGVPVGVGRGVKVSVGAGDVTVGVTVGVIVGVPVGVGVGTQAANSSKVTIQYRFVSRIGYIMPPC